MPTFDSPGELEEKMLYFLRHDDQRLSAVEQGQNIVRENFSYDALIQRLLNSTYRNLYANVLHETH